MHACNTYRTLGSQLSNRRLTGVDFQANNGLQHGAQP